MDQEPMQGFRIDEVAVDPSSGELAGPGGREQLDPKVMALLLLLARQAGEVVPRHRIFAVLWPGVIVTDDVLKRCIYKLRVHLSDAGGHARYKQMIETLPKRGYRLRCLPAFHAGAGLQDVQPATTRGGLRTAVTVLAATLLLAASTSWMLDGRAPAPRPDPATVSAEALRGSIAVLPFADMSAGHDQEYFGDGIAEEILHLLAQGSELKVISRTSSFSFKNQPADIATIAARLGVAHVLEGSVRKSGNRVRVTAQLISARDGVHVWSQSYDRELDDLLRVQSEIAGAVAGVLNTRLLDRRDLGARRAPSSSAYEHFMRAGFLFHRRNPGDITLAQEHYARALNIDPEFAPAWVGLAATYLDAPDPAGLATGLAAVARALELDPDLPEAHLRAAQLYGASGDFHAAVIHTRTAESLDPGNVLLLGVKAGAALAAGESGSSVALQERVVALDPLSFVNRQNLAAYYLVDGRLPEARATFLTARELNPAMSDEIAADVARTLVLEGRYEEAQALVEGLPVRLSRDGVQAIAWSGMGREAEARQAMARIAAEPTVDAAFHLADIHAFRGESEESLRWVAEARRRLRAESGSSREPCQWRALVHLSPFLKRLRSDPGWTVALTWQG
jgi:adenylate cyclase